MTIKKYRRTFAFQTACLLKTLMLFQDSKRTPINAKNKVT